MKSCAAARAVAEPKSAGAVLSDRLFAEFFAGIGLMRMGLEREGWSVAFANDIAPDKRQMYEAHFGDTARHFVLRDIHEVKADEVPSVALATASFPCNDLSLAGMRKGLEGAQSSAYWGFIRILRDLGGRRRPPVILLENVAGFLTSHEGRDFQDALLALNDLGYSVDPFVIDAARFVPQSRVRLFVVAVRTPEWGPSSVAEGPVFYESDLRPAALAKFIFGHPEINWSLRDLPALPRRGISLGAILDDLPDNAPDWWSDDRRDYLMSQMSDKHAATLRGLVPRREWTYCTVFRRVRHGRSMAELRTDGVAGCLRTPRGGSGRQILVRAGFGRVMARLLTPSECARLMGADGFHIDVPLNQALFGFGDAVCVPVVSWIAKHYLNPLVAEMLEDAESRGSAQAYSVPASRPALSAAPARRM